MISPVMKTLFTMRASRRKRCHQCAEEKTFSRNDALTRHMRVVHPDVDWPLSLLVSPEVTAAAVMGALVNER